MKSKTELNKIEKNILRVLAQHRGALSINEVAELAGISWVTARKYLAQLADEGLILEGGD